MMKLNQRGDTMVEVLLSLAILSLVLISALAVTNRSYGLGRAANERTQAVNYMQQQGEALHSFRDKTPWTTFKNRFAGGGRHHMILSAGDWNEANGALTPGFAGGTGEVWIVMTDDSVHGDGDKAQFEINATWRDSTGSHSSRVITQVANIDLVP